MRAMKQKPGYSLAALLTAVVMASCNDGYNRSKEESQDPVNLTDTRRNTTDTLNTIPDTAAMKADTTNADTSQQRTGRTP